MSIKVEDKIIAYFDGELSDADSAELLHLTSVSPEIRDLFREHEMLRELAHDAVRIATVSPEVESLLLSRIEALAEKEVVKTAPLVFSRRTVTIAALALVLISGSLGYLIPRILSNSTQQSSQNIVERAKDVVASVQPSVTSQIPKESVNIESISGALFTSPKQNAILAGERLRSIMITPNHVAELSEQVIHPDITESFLELSNSESGDVHPISVQEEDIHPTSSGEKLSPFALMNSPEDSRSLFELSLQTSSGFTYPADATPIAPFADQRLSIAYHFTENNLIGLRLGSGLFQQLGGVTRSQENGVEVLRRDIETKRSFSEELFFSHLVPIYFLAPFSLEFSVGGGLIPNGFTIGAEAGIRIPVSESFMFNFAFELSRVHSNALSSQAILASETTSMQPVLLESVDIHNTLNGRLHYGIAYKF